MKIINGKDIRDLINWVEIDVPHLVRQEQDVRVTLSSGKYLFGSLKSGSPRTGEIQIQTYGAPSVSLAVNITDISKIEVLDSHRLRPDRAYAQMNEMMSIIHP